MVTSLDRHMKPFLSLQTWESQLQRLLQCAFYNAIVGYLARLKSRPIFMIGDYGLWPHLAPVKVSWWYLHCDNCDLVVPRTSRNDRWQGFLCCRTPCLESAADRLETFVFDCFIQEQTEEFSVSCCLHREHYVNFGMRHRSDCRRRTTSHCCYCYCYSNGSSVIALTKHTHTLKTTQLKTTHIASLSLPGWQQGRSVFGRKQN